MLYFFHHQQAQLILLNHQIFAVNHYIAQYFGLGDFFPGEFSAHAVDLAINQDHCLNHLMF